MKNKESSAPTAPTNIEDYSIPIAVPVSVTSELIVESHAILPTTTSTASSIHHPSIIETHYSTAEAENSMTQGCAPAPSSSDLVAIPSHFYQCSSLCCAINCCYWDCPNCFGYKGNCYCCCIEKEEFCCKTIANTRSCCILVSRKTECVNCLSSCKCYRQCCCFEIICIHPYDELYHTTNVIIRDLPNRIESLEGNNAVLCLGCCCCLNNISCNLPECLSGYMKTTCLCMESEEICCRGVCFDQNKPNPNTLCLIGKGQCFLIPATTCCKGVVQLFCLDHRRACPSDEEVPCVFTLFPFCTICIKWGWQVYCCSTIGKVRRHSP